MSLLSLQFVSIPRHRPLFETLWNRCGEISPVSSGPEEFATCRVRCGQDPGRGNGSSGFGQTPAEKRISRFARPGPRIAVTLPLAQEGFFLPAMEGMATGKVVVYLECVGNCCFCQHDWNYFRTAYDSDFIGRACVAVLEILDEKRIQMTINAAAASAACMAGFTKPWTRNEDVAIDQVPGITFRLGGMEVRLIWKSEDLRATRPRGFSSHRDTTYLTIFLRPTLFFAVPLPAGGCVIDRLFITLNVSRKAGL
mgnify:CR=1 FL=1